MSSYDAKIIGAGSWGRALAHALLQNKKKVLIFSRSSENEYSSNNIQQTNNIDEVFADDGPVVIATPVSTLSDIGQLIKKNNFSGALLLACKGIDPHLGLFPSEIISKYVDSKKIAILSGPSFAEEVIKNHPTAVTLASNNEHILNTFSNLFRSKFFRIYLSDDLIGCQIGGAMKNILSVAVGISDGLGLGPNAKAALITRGILEIKILGETLKCSDKTIYGLSGLGDLVLTSNDNLSRNRRFGIEIAKGASVIEAEKKIGQVVEGIYASKGLNILIKKYSLNLPICSKVNDIINETISPEEAVNDLLIRTQKKEFV